MFHAGKPGVFNSLLWSVVVGTGDSYLEGFHALFERPSGATPAISLEGYPRGNALAAELRQGEAAFAEVRARVTRFWRSWHER